MKKTRIVTSPHEANFNCHQSSTLL